jgi:hypothetical protein
MSTLPASWNNYGLVERYQMLYNLAQQGSPERLEVVEWLASVRADRITADNQRRSTLIYDELYTKAHNMRLGDDMVTFTALVTLPFKGGVLAATPAHMLDIYHKHEITANSVTSNNPHPAAAIAVYEYFLALIQQVDATRDLNPALILTGQFIDKTRDQALDERATDLAQWIVPTITPLVVEDDFTNLFYDIALRSATAHQFHLSVSVPTILLSRIQAIMGAGLNSEAEVFDATADPAAYSGRNTPYEATDELGAQVLVGTSVVSEVYEIPSVLIGTPGSGNDLRIKPTDIFREFKLVL